jgi:hypothetical protein
MPPEATRTREKKVCQIEIGGVTGYAKNPKARLILVRILFHDGKIMSHQIKNAFANDGRQVSSTFAFRAVNPIVVILITSGPVTAWAGSFQYWQLARLGHNRTHRALFLIQSSTKSRSAFPFAITILTISRTNTPSRGTKFGAGKFLR